MFPALSNRQRLFASRWGCLVLAFCGVSTACKKKTTVEKLDYSYDVLQSWEYGNDLFVQFDSVFWEPDDTLSLQRIITEQQGASGRTVLEIGTGTGLLSVLCLQNGADKVVATDINPAAVANAKYNAAMLAIDDTFDVRQVSKRDPSAFSALKHKEKFDLIISNPPWEDGEIDKPADHAYYDPSFALMDSILDGLPERLNKGGRCLLAYGHVPAVERLLREARRRGYDVEVLDERKLEELPKDFLPGLLTEIRIPLGYQTLEDEPSQDPIL